MRHSATGWHNERNAFWAAGWVLGVRLLTADEQQVKADAAVLTVQALAQRPAPLSCHRVQEPSHGHGEWP